MSLGRTGSTVFYNYLYLCLDKRNIKGIIKNMNLRKIDKFMNIVNFLVFLSVSILVISIFYEGLVLEWYTFVTIMLLVTDGFFIISTILNLIFSQKNKILFYFSIFSIIFIAIMLILKFFKIEHPKWGVTIWYFYIFYFYGIQVFTKFYKNMKTKRTEE